MLTEEQRQNIQLKREAALKRREERSAAGQLCEVSSVPGPLRNEAPTVPAALVDSDDELRADVEPDSLAPCSSGKNGQGLCRRASTKALCCDVDDTAEMCVGGSKKRRVLKRTPTEGADNLEDCMGWVQKNVEVMHRLEVSSRASYRTTLSKAVRDKIVVTEAYAGAGNGAGVMSQVFGEVGRLLDLGDMSENVVVYSAWDVDPLCRRVLLRHKPSTNARHVFGDLLDRLSTETRTAAQEIMERHVTSFKKLKEERCGTQMHPPSISNSEFEQKRRCLTDSLLQSLEHILGNASFSEEAWCYKHQCMCPISPRSDPELRGLRWIEVGGHTCNPWSNMGSKNQFLDSATLPALAWVWSCRYFQVDDLVTECTPAFKPEPFLDIMNKEPSDDLSCPLREEAASPYAMESLTFSPTDLGFPSLRKRLYAWLWRQRTVQRTIAGDGGSIFQELFYRTCAADARIFLQADPAVRRSHQKAWAEERGEGWVLGMIEGPSSSDGGALLDLGPFGRSILRVRRDQYREALQNSMKDKPGPMPVLLVNLSQNADFMFNKSTMAPCLLSCSMLFDLASDREVLPVEHFLIQGFPVPGLVSEALSRYFPFPDIVQLPFPSSEMHLKCSEIRAVTGKGFSWPAFGAVAMLLLSTSART